MKKLESKQFLPISLETAWDYFSSPKNLNDITPPEMVFNILSELPERMYEGIIIVYKIKPFLNFSIKWVTEITHIKENHFFVDEQRQGPFKIWHHEHHFEKVEG